MNAFFRKLWHNTKARALLLIMIGLFIISICIFPSWYLKQYNKIFGFYYVYKGDKAYKAGKFPKAVEYYIKAIKFYPEHKKARCNLGSLYVVYENYYGAADSYDAALQVDPNYMTCRMDYGIILSEQMADYDKAIQEYGKIIESKPFILYIPLIFNNKKSVKENKGIAYYNMGVAYKNKSLYMGENKLAALRYLQKAKQAYDSAQVLLPKDYDTSYNSALTNHLLGNIKEAGLAYCKAIENKPYNFEAHYNYAILLRSLKFYKEALIELEKAGLMADKEANSVQSEYVYRVLGDMKQRLATNDELSFLAERVELSSSDSSVLAYKNGKVILNKEDDKILRKELMTCPKKEYFEGL